MLPIVDVICFIILGIIIGVFIYYSRCLTICIKKYKELNSEYDVLYGQYGDLIKSAREVQEKRDELTNQISDLTNQLTKSQQESKEAFENYTVLLNKEYSKAVVSHTEKLAKLEEDLQARKDEAILEYDTYIEDLQEQWKTKVEQVQALMSTVDAANEAIRKAELDEKQRAAYQLYISEEDLSDVKKLLELCNSFKNPRALRMIVWSSYFQKETNNLCTRIKANNITGIYKITNILNNRVYIGQAKSISDRWKTHIKCGLGIDTPVTNSLYKAMLHDGVWNFTFEVLEECPQEKLNECERKWIAFFSSDEVGYNGNKGVGK